MPLNQIDISALVSLSSSLGYVLSHDKSRLAYYDNSSGRYELYVTEVATKTSRRVSDGQLPATPRSGLVWLRDNRTVVFGKDERGNEQSDLYSLNTDLNTDTLELQQLTSTPTAQDIALEAHPDGARLLMLSSRTGQMQLHWLDLQTLETVQLTSFKNPVGAGKLSRDGSKIAFSANETDNTKNQDVYLMNADGSEQRQILSLETGSLDIPAAWSEDGQLLAVQSDAGGEWRAGIHDLAANTTRWVSSGASGIAEFPQAFSPDGRWLLCLRDADASYAPVLYDILSHQARTLALPPGVATGGEWLSSTRLLCSYQSPTRRTEVSIYDLETDETQVLRAADLGNLDPRLFVEPEYLRYPSFDAQPVPAFVYAPRDAAPGQRFPAVVVVHGGPTAHFPRMFDAQAQLLSDRGYVVLMPNIRGSTGYGNAWRDANLKDWGGADLQDVMCGVTYLQSRADVIADRIGITGGSFGGYMTFIASVKHPDAFKVAIPIIGITDLHQLYQDNSRLLPALGYYFKRMMGDPVEDAELWRDRSAITYASQLQAKMLIVHGRNDPRCPLNQATRFIEKLKTSGKTQGVDFEVDIFDEGHGSANRALQERQYRLITDYLERYL
jgi:dipeptidyl aminopeptidase/acylaminoacyl peptidase